MTEVKSAFVSENASLLQKKPGFFMICALETHSNAAKTRELRHALFSRAAV
jgi:hypothetical protein